MAYQLDRFSQGFLTTVEDGTIDQTTDLKFIGKNYAGYGEIQNENLLFLLENFAGANQPPRPVSGQVWFDTGNNKLKFYDGNIWRTTGGAEISASQPSGLTEGDFWWDRDANQLYAFNGSEFVLIGPQNAGEGVTAMVSIEVLDEFGATQSIIASTVEDEVVTIISPVAFKLNATNPITGFDQIHKGVTLKWTQSTDGGVTNSVDSSYSLSDPRDYRFWGTASNSDRLGGLPASNFITNVDPTFTNEVSFTNGIALGESPALKIYMQSGTNNGFIENTRTPSSSVTIKTNDTAGISKNSLVVNSTGIIPGVDSEYNIGSLAAKWNEVHAANFKGIADKADTLADGVGNYITASVSATPTTIAIRDSQANITANLFKGVATQARYADLAEKYTTDKEYPVGTVMAVGGTFETRAASISDLAIGVISAEPAYLMNSEIEGQAIGLKGRVPVRIKGPVSKGQAIYTWQDGVASTIKSNGLVGVALETNNDNEEKLVECVLKV